MMKHLLFTVLLVAASLGFSQAQEKPLIQFSGVTLNKDTNAVVPFVNIYNKSNGNRNFQPSSYKGYFSVVVHEGDTIVFRSIGYGNEAIVIPSGLLDKKYTVWVRMRPQSINLPMVTILPWLSIDDFNKDFLSMKIADDDEAIARKNVSQASIMAMSKTLYRDAGEQQSLNFANNHFAIGNRNMNSKGANPLLNPFAWGALVKQILEGDKKRSN